LVFADLALHCSIGRADIGSWSKGCQFMLRSTNPRKLSKIDSLDVPLLQSTDSDD
jgi:hypothetical protein